MCEKIFLPGVGIDNPLLAKANRDGLVQLLRACQKSIDETLIFFV